MEQPWYKLDNAAKIYPAVRGKEWEPIFRLSCVLKDPVDHKLLEAALLMIYRRFPAFTASIRKGLFWFYLDNNESKPLVRQESEYPARPFHDDRDKGYLFRILYYRNRISLEAFHSLSDGYGAMVFLKTLIFHYLLLRDTSLPVDYTKLEDYGILYYKDLPTEEETEDSFLHYAAKNQELDLKETTPYKIHGTKIKKNAFRVTHVLLHTDQLLALSKRYGVTVTQFLTALFIHSIAGEKTYQKAQNKRIKISVPINLRRLFPSKTLRNFSSYLNVEVVAEVHEKPKSLGDICEEVKEQMKKAADYQYLRMRFSGNVHAERNIMARLAPLFAKICILRAYYHLYGERLVTSTLSNLGPVTMPPYMEDEVERFDAFLARPRKNSYVCAVASYRNILSASFSSGIYENSILKNFINFLTGEGLEVEVETNY